MTNTNKDREAFEDWYWARYHVVYDYSNAYRPNLFSRHEDGTYRLIMVHDSFLAYQAALVHSADRIAELEKLHQFQLATILEAAVGRLTRNSDIPDEFKTPAFNSVAFLREQSRQQLAEATATIAAKDEALKELLEDTQHSEHNCGDEQHCCVFKARKALALTPSKEVLEGYVKSVLGEPVGVVVNTENSIYGANMRGDVELLHGVYLYTLKPVETQSGCARFEKTHASFRTKPTDESET